MVAYSSPLFTMISYCFRMPEEEGKWMVSFEVFYELHLQYPMLVENLSTCEEW
ncbi:hypothetical protein ACQRAV_03835 [Segatella copri]|uniref:hypothetical protein n=1 Tax=Segatella copri TaxID=165179 RepID=UPI003D02F9F4